MRIPLGRADYLKAHLPPEYRKDLNAVVQGLDACRSNTRALLRAADQLKATQFHAPALSLSVLALEEAGKLILVDALLFAREGDYKTHGYDAGYRDHREKLRIIDVFPYAVRSLALHNPSYGVDSVYTIDFVERIRDYQARRTALAPWLGSACELKLLDVWKQRGFYVQEAGSGFVTPGEAIPVDFAAAVLALAASVVGTLDHYLTTNSARYFRFAEKARGRLTDSDLDSITNIVRDRPATQ